MPSGQQVAEENVRKFTAWAASKTDVDFRSMVVKGVLSRTDIAAECGFAKSALAQNPRIRDGLKELESRLRASAVLPKVATEAVNTSRPPKVVIDDRLAAPFFEWMHLNHDVGGAR